MNNPAWKALSALTAAMLLFVATSGHAALVGVTPTQPDITANNTTTVNDWSNAQGGSGTLTIDGAFASSLTLGIYADSGLGLNENVVLIYSLTLNYDDTFDFTPGTGDTSGTISISLDGSSAAIAGVANPGDTLVTGSLTAFGFSGSGASGVMDYTFDITSGAWFTLGYGPTGGIVNNISLIDSPPIGAWTTANLLVGQDWTATGGLNNTDTYTTSVIPVPAALWLFLSGMVGLIGVSRRKNK